MRYIEWEIENYPDRYSQLRCNQVLDMQTLAHVIGNVDRPDGVKWEDFKKVLAEVAETINIVPAVDAEPVRHGRWIYRNESVFPDYACSLCGCTSIFVADAKYCPVCGAKMDGGREPVTKEKEETE